MAFLLKHIPEEIVVDILLRLPLKDLVGCRAVAKPWLQFLTFSKFPQWLLERHISCDPLIRCPHDQSFLILCFDNHGYVDSRRGCRLLAMGGGSQESNFTVASEINSPLIRGKVSFQIKTACCDGMLCLTIHDDDALVLWNPTTGAHKSIPVPAHSGLPGGVCGLGFDPLTEDYKVVSILGKKAMHVFSVKTNLWKKIGDFSLPYLFFNEGIPVNGCLYWTVNKTRKFGDLIVCLNLSDYRLTEVSLPPYYFKQEGETDRIMEELSLLAWRNCLCVYRHSDQTIWVLEEDEDKESDGIKYMWTHKLTLPMITCQNFRFRYHYRLQPRCFTKTGRLIVAVKNRQYVYFDGKGYQDLHVEGLIDGYHNSVVYSGTLIFPQDVCSLEDID